MGWKEPPRQTCCDLEIRDANKIEMAPCLRTLLKSEETVIKNLVRCKCCHMLRLYLLPDGKGNGWEIVTINRILFDYSEFPLTSTSPLGQKLQIKKNESKLKNV